MSPVYVKSIKGSYLNPKFIFMFYFSLFFFTLMIKNTRNVWHIKNINFVVKIDMANKKKEDHYAKCFFPEYFHACLMSQPLQDGVWEEWDIFLRNILREIMCFAKLSFLIMLKFMYKLNIIPRWAYLCISSIINFYTILNKKHFQSSWQKLKIRMTPCYWLLFYMVTL